MTAAQYASARARAGRWMGPSIATPFNIARGIPGDLPPHATAIYIAELGDGRPAYVGQTRRGTAVRLGDHIRRWDRARRWVRVWVVPLLDEVPKRDLDRIEGRIGYLLKPSDTLMLPRRF